MDQGFWVKGFRLWGPGCADVALSLCYQTLVQWLLNKPCAVHLEVGWEHDEVGVDTAQVILPQLGADVLHDEINSHQ